MHSEPPRASIAASAAAAVAARDAGLVACLTWAAVVVVALVAQAHVGLLEANVENHPALILGMDYLVNISYVDVSAAPAVPPCSAAVASRSCARAFSTGGSSSRRCERAQPLSRGRSPRERAGPEGAAGRKQA